MLSTEISQELTKFHNEMNETDQAVTDSVRGSLLSSFIGTITKYLERIVLCSSRT